MSDKPYAYQAPRPLRDPSAKDVVRIVHISDTHDQDYNKIPSGDILVHTGDWTNYGRPEEVKKFVAYLKRQPHAHKVIIAGNHEVGLDRLTTPELQELITNGGTTPNVHFLNDTSATVCGVKFYGSPWNNCSMAWPAPDPKDRAAKWEKIPADTDVLLTHNPPFGMLDLAWESGNDPGHPCQHCNGRKHRNYQHWGCWPMLQKVDQLKIPVHCFGHVHDEVGIVPPPKDGSRVTTFSNAAMDIKRRPCVIDVLVTDKSKTDPVPLTATQELALKNQNPDAAVAKPSSTTGLSLPLSNVRLAPFGSFSSQCVLDLDSHDKSRSSLLFWSPNKQIGAVNQLWNLDPVPTDGEQQQRCNLEVNQSCTVIIRSAWGSTDKQRLPDRALHYAPWTAMSGPSDIHAIRCCDTSQFDPRQPPVECQWKMHVQQYQPETDAFVVSFESMSSADCLLASAGRWDKGDMAPVVRSRHQLTEANEQMYWLVHKTALSAPT